MFSSRPAGIQASVPPVVQFTLYLPMPPSSGYLLNRQQLCKLTLTAEEYLNLGPRRIQNWVNERLATYPMASKYKPVGLLGFKFDPVTQEILKGNSVGLDCLLEEKEIPKPVETPKAFGPSDEFTVFRSINAALSELGITPISGNYSGCSVTLRNAIKQAIRICIRKPGLNAWWFSWDGRDYLILPTCVVAHVRVSLREGNFKVKPTMVYGKELQSARDNINNNFGNVQQEIR
jgi:hypothetical protein